MAELCLEVRVKNSFWREDSTETQRSQWTDGSKLHKGLFDLNVGNTEARRKKKKWDEEQDKLPVLKDYTGPQCTSGVIRVDVARLLG